MSMPFTIRCISNLEFFKKAITQLKLIAKQHSKVLILYLNRNLIVYINLGINQNIMVSTNKTFGFKTLGPFYVISQMLGLLLVKEIYNKVFCSKKGKFFLKNNHHFILIQFKSLLFIYLFDVLLIIIIYIPTYIYYIVKLK